MYLIYRHTSPSGKSYIGLTSNLYYRTWRHLRSDSGCIAFKNAIQKYGFDSFTTDILAKNLTLEEANILEEQYILEYNTLSPNGYNLHTGGNHHQVSEETRQKISIKMKEINKSRKGIKRDPTILEKRKQTNLERYGTTYGRYSDINYSRGCSEETKRKLSEKAKGRKHTEETKKKLSEGSPNKGKIPMNAKPVVIDGIMYPSIRQAATSLGVHCNTIRNKLKRRLNND